MRPRRGLLVLALLPVLGGCYTYIAADPRRVTVGEQVRVHLTREGVLGLPDLTGREGPVLVGAIADGTPDRLSLRVPVVVRRDGFLQNTLGQNVVLPLDQIGRIEIRTLSRSRTGLVALGTAGAAAAVIFTIVESSLFREQPGPSSGSDLRPSPF